MAFNIWNIMQRAGVFFNRICSFNAEYLLLQHTAFSLEADLHSTNLNDVKTLTERVVASLA